MTNRGQWRKMVGVVIRLAAVLALVVTSWASIAQPATAQSTATLNLTLRGCPEGVVPQSVNPAVTCDIPLDAPGSAGIHWSQGQGSLLIVNQGRLWDGTYSISVPANVPLTLYNLEPAVRDDYMAVGADTFTQGGDPVITLAPGQTRSVGIYYYYYYAQGSGQSSGAIEPVGTGSTTTASQAPATSSAPETTPATGTVYVISSIAGWPFLDGCYELVDFSEPICSIMIRDMTYAAIFQNVPAGTYTVRQTNDIGDNYVPDFTIDVTGGEEEFLAEVIMPWGSPSRNGGTKQFFDIENIDYDYSAWPRDTDNVTMVFIDTETREKVASDACVQIIDASNVGCDTNRGQIDFLDIPGGPHDVIVTNVPDGYVLGPGMENLQLENSGGTPNGPFHVVYFIDLEPVSGSGDAPDVPAGDAPAADATAPDTSASGSSIVRIHTTISGWPYTQACYELVGFSDSVCSILVADMTYHAIFQGVPHGTYTVRQTDGFGENDSVYVPDFTIEVTEDEQVFDTAALLSYGSPSRSGVASPSDIGIEFVSDFQDYDSFAVYVVFIDVESREKVTSDACAQILGASNVACDTQRGQIDFTYVPPGNYEVMITRPPAGYELAPGMEHLPIAIPGRSSAAEPFHLVYFIDVVPADGS